MTDPSAHRLKFLIVDDHALFVEGLGLMLERRWPGSLVLEARNGLAALDIVQQHADLDLAVVDLAMPGLGGLDLMEQLEARRMTVPVVIVSGSIDPADVAKAIDAGALGYIPKQLAPEALFEALRQVLEGNLYLPSALAREVAAWRKAQLLHGTRENVSPRQLDVLRLMREGLGNIEIAHRLNLSGATVKTHVAALMRATGTRNRTACILSAIEKRLVP